MNYRILKEGETILPSDQYLDNGKWIAPNCIGEKAPNPQFTSHRIYRRKNPAAVALGRLGGRAGRGAVKARTSEQARRAVMVRWRPRFEVGWSYPTSPNASKFGFVSTGCWTVSKHVGTKPPIELAGFAEKSEAEAYVRELTDNQNHT